MTQDEIIEMARQAGMDYLQYLSPEAFEKVVVFSKLVAAKAIAKAIKELESQEPVAWVNQSAIDWLNGNMQGSNEYVQTNLAKRKNNSATVPIYTHPPQRTWVDLTDEEILDVFDAKNVYGSKWLEFARALEAKLKEKKHDLSNLQP